jgi:predicted ester cyclase
MLLSCDKDKTSENDMAATNGESTVASVVDGVAKKAAAPIVGNLTMTRFRECWDAYNAKDTTAFRDCYGAKSEFEIVDSTPPKRAKGADAALLMAQEYWQAFPDIRSEAQLILVNGSNVAAIIHTTGTNKGSLMQMPATGKSISMFQAQTVELDAKGKVVTSQNWIDSNTMMHQLGIRSNEKAPASETPWATKVAVVAKGDDSEKANLATANKMAEKMIAGEDEAYFAHVHKDASFRYIGDKEVMQGADSYRKGYASWKEMVDHKGTQVSHWAAGDWVVSVHDAEATLKKDMPGTTNTKGKTVKTRQLELLQFADGKLKTHWMFENSGAYNAQLGLDDKLAQTKEAVGAQSPTAKMP